MFSKLKQPRLPKTPVDDPTKATRSLAIALVVSAVLLLAAAGVVIWLVVANGSHKTGTHVVAPDDTKDVKNVSFVPPASLPANYVKNDQSTRDASNVYYYDDATNCGITVGVIPMPDDKTIKEVVVGAITAAQTQGVTTTANTDGDKYAIKDADGKKTYNFDSVVLEQDVKVDGVPYTQQNHIIAYKQFGAQAALIGYSCKREVWAEKQTELAALVKQFTAKTER